MFIVVFLAVSLRKNETLQCRTNLTDSRDRVRVITKVDTLYRYIQVSIQVVLKSIEFLRYKNWKNHGVGTIYPGRLLCYIQSSAARIYRYIVFIIVVRDTYDNDVLHEITIIVDPKKEGENIQLKLFLFNLIQLKHTIFFLK